MNQEVYAKTIGHQAHFEAGFRAGGDRVLDEFYDEGGLPIHFPMGVNAKGQGPVNDSDAHHWVCWCNDDRCMWNQALLSNRKTE